MREKDFQTEFGKRNTLRAVFELKFCKGKSLPFSALALHQEQALLDISGMKGLFHKITDSPFFKDPKGRMRFTRPKPFDCFYLSNMSAYIVVLFWEPRKKKNVYYIYIRDWIRMREEANRKSLTEAMAKKHCVFRESYLKKEIHEVKTEKT